ncbi:hypothetical protein ABH926_010056 [Catenulispora sp. GP43]|uniref:hypothetical protein n=1 Tax=Catenulispora sp. GP43 TaxID=3156263 RepID=UPI003519492E
MTTTPEPPPAHDDESGASGPTAAGSAGAGAGAGTGSGGPAGPAGPAIPDDPADDRFDRRIALGVVAALAVVGTVGPFGWHLLSNVTGSSKASGAVAAVAAGGGGAGSNGAAAVIVATTSSPSASPTTSGSSAAESASASCAAAVAGAKTGSGTAPTVNAWVVKAAPSVGALRSDSATLKAVVVSQDAAAVPAAAKALCDNVSTASLLDANPDSVNATGWQAALSAYVAAATDALAGANHPAYFQAAQAQLAQGEQELDVLTAHITATANR